MYVLCLLGMLSGCASQGPLHPPSLKLPAPVKQLAADRVGGAVDLHWTNPSKTTDGIGLAGKHGAGQLTAEICRSKTAADVDSCDSSGRIAVKAGEPSVFQDVLPPPLVSGVLRPLRYRVRVLNGAGKGAKYVAVDTLAGTAPPEIHGLVAAPDSNGVALRWQPDTAADGARTILRVERIRGTTSPHSGTGSPPHTDLLAVEPAAHDSGGAIDTGARPGIEQRYTVFRTQTVLAAGQALVASSPPATVTVSAAAKAPPPPPPAGLEALVNTLGAPEIDLVWQPVEGASAYLVFRAEGDGLPIRLTTQPVTGLSYADKDIHPGPRYRYSIASVDAAGATGQHSANLVQVVLQP